MHTITWTDKLGKKQETILPSSRAEDIKWLIDLLTKNGIKFEHVIE